MTKKIFLKPVFIKNNKRQKAKKPKAGMFLRKMFKAVLNLLLFIIILSIILTLVIDLYVSGTGKRFLKKPDEISGDFDCIIIPGASVIGNKVPSAILQDRLDVAYDLYRSTGIGRMIVSGDHGTVFYDEVNVMRNYLIARGVPGENIFMDHAGFDTYQTLYRARDVFDVRKAVIVTQNFHLYRALYIGKKLGIELYGVDSAVRKYGKEVYNRLREFPARVKAFIECEIIRPEPEFLGEKIPVSGENRTLD
ncbi:MAG: SanA/YdcF family protein [Saccharofermentanales bacterium]